MPAISLVFGGISIILLAAYRFLFRTGRLPNEPNEIPTWIPFFGHAFTFAKDKRSFYRWASDKNHEQPFSALIGGRKHYIFHDPADVAAIHKQGKSLHIRGFVRFIYISIWGFTKRDADKMWDIKPEWHRIDTDWLLQPEKNQVITEKYFTKLEEQLTKLDQRIEASPNKAVNEAGLKAVVDLEGKATVQTMYGETTLELNPGLLDDLTIMVRDGFWGLMFRAPKFLYRKSYDARERLIVAFANLIENIDTRKDVSTYIAERTEYLNSHGISPMTQGADLLRTMFASLLNSMPTGYLAMLHILETPGLIDQVRDELTAAGYQNLAPAELVQIIPQKVPLLRSIWHETLRMHNNSLTVREVIADTQVMGKDRAWGLQKGNVVTIPCGLMHFDEKLHPDPDGYHPRRFLDKALGGEGEGHAKTTKPFGGGSTHCPGRVFAEKQMIGLVAGILMRYDVEITSPTYTIPMVSEFDDIANRPPIYFRFSKRKDVSAAA